MKAFGIGNLTKDPDLRTTQSGKSVATFTLACSRKFKGRDGERQTDFFTIVVWGPLAEICAKHLEKGKKVSVIGELQTRSYEKDGQKRYVTEIVADEVEFLSPRETREEPQESVAEGFAEIEDNDLPF